MGKTELPNARKTPRFAGIPTFLRYPRLEDVRRENAPVDWAIYGAPFDGGVTYRPGARFGPRAIRMESLYVKRYSLTHDVDVCDALSIADAGDAPLAPYSCEENARQQFEFARGLGGEKTKRFAVGGDHSIAYANIQATWERQGKPKKGLGLVHFDAHLDTVDAVWGEKWGHASVFRRAIEDGLIDPKRMVSIGIRGPLNTRDDVDAAKKLGITVLTVEELRAKGLKAIAPLKKRVGGGAAYLSFDIDCVDPAYAPGTGTPCAGGLTSGDALDAIRAFAGIDLVGADVVEVLPDRDVSGITALLAAHAIFEVLCLSAIRAAK